LITLALVLSQCTKKYPGESQSFSATTKDGCVGCHTDKAQLQKVADPLPHTEGDSGEG